MSEQESLRRLGGERWQTRDRRFTIEPQSGTWVVVDDEQTDELGLPVLRGPYASLADARAAIGAAREDDRTASPLTERLEEARARAAGRPDRPTRAGTGSVGRRAGPPRPARAGGRARPPEVSGPPTGPRPRERPRPPEPSGLPGPAWFRALPPGRQGAARALLERLVAQDVPESDAQPIVRAEIGGGDPALVRLAMEGRLAASLWGLTSPSEATRAAVDVLLTGRDETLRVEWRLVDGSDRPIARLEVPDRASWPGSR
jgi:hypothetical protein